MDAGLVGSAAFADWAVPAILLIAVLGVGWIGVRWARSENLEAIRAVPLFSLLSQHSLMTVLRSAQVVDYPPGGVLVEEGSEQGKGAFIITEGTVVVSLEGNELASLGPGSFFGEMSVIDGGPRSATITARTRTTTLQISASSLSHLLDREPMIAQGIYQELARRLKAAGVEVDEDAGGSVDRARLVEMSTALRRTQAQDWSQTTSSHPRNLRLTKLFARNA